MGSDDLFKKRKARANNALARQQQQRTESPRCLIVCEGSKTEPHYLAELREVWGIPHSWVNIKPSEGSSPDRVVQTAERLYVEDARMGDSFDQVFCVFDRDAHPTFSQAVQRTRELASNGKPFKAITSTPCFEFWFLLHFGYSDAPFAKAGKKSVGDVVVNQFKTKAGLAQYAKAQKGMAAQLQGKFAAATKHATKLRQSAAKTQNQDPQIYANPWTNVDELVQYIEGLKC
jgi:hypothetical protein